MLRALGSARSRLRRAPDGPAAVAALRLLAPVGPGGFDVPTAAGLLGRSEPRAESLLDLLTEHGLLLAADDGRYGMHPLTALFGRSAPAGRPARPGRPARSARR